jgi:uncharacterized protein YwgA
MLRQDWLLVYLHLPLKGKINLIDPIRIMKGLFLFKMKFGERLAGFYEYKPYLYGPCSFEIYNDLLKFQLEGIVAEYSLPSSRWNYYKLTEKGEARVREMQDVPADLLRELEAIKQKVTGLSFINLLKEVYREYPEFAKKSVVHFGGKP